MVDPVRFAARGFGPGLPPEGAGVSAILSNVLQLEGWPESGSRIALNRLEITRPSARQLHITWEASGGKCALVLNSGVGAGETNAKPETTALQGGRAKDALCAVADGDTPSSVFAEVLGRLPGAAKSSTDHSTRNWVAGIVFVLVVLPLMLLFALFAFRSEMLDWVVAKIPVEQEIKLADKLWQVQGGPLPKLEGTAANLAVEQIGARLVAAAPTPYRYRFFVGKDDSVNAFAMPAGYIVVNVGLIKQAKSAEELAGVLAHEIAHVEQRHAVRGIVQSLGFAALWLTLTGDIGTSVAGEGVRQLAGLHFSREQETAADDGGFARLRAAGISPHGMVSFFSTLQQKGGAIPESMTLLSSHPSSAERSERLQKMLQGLPLVAPLEVDWKAVQQSY